MNRGAGNLLGTSLLLAGLLLTLGVILSMVLHDAGVVMLVGLLFGAPATIFGAVLLIRVNARPYPDDLIATNAGWLWAAPLMGAITLFFYYLLVQAIGVLVSFLLYEVTIVVATALLVWRPWYPFRFFLYTLDPDSLSPARLRVLSFLRSPECIDASVRAVAWMTSGLVIVTLSFFVLQHAGYLASAKPTAFTKPWGLTVAVVVSLIPVALTAFCTQIGAVLYLVLARWDYLQVTYSPSSPSLVRESFFMASSKREFSEASHVGPAPENPVDSMLQEFVGPVHWQRAAGLLCWVVGLLGLFFGVSGLVKLLGSHNRLDSSASLRLVLYTVIPGVLLIALGQRWWRRS